MGTILATVNEMKQKTICLLIAAMIAIGVSAQERRKHVGKIELPTMTYVVDNSFGALNNITGEREVNVKYIQIYKDKIDFRNNQKELWKRVSYVPKETSRTDGWLMVDFYNEAERVFVSVNLKAKEPFVLLVISDSNYEDLVNMSFPIDITATVEFMERTQNK